MEAISEGNELKPGPRIQMKMRDRSMEATKGLEPDDTFRPGTTASDLSLYFFHLVE
jgi:hypothetical protein